MKNQLKSLLAKPIVAPGTSLRYLTSGKSSDIGSDNTTFVQELIGGTSKFYACSDVVADAKNNFNPVGHEGMLGVKKGDAKKDMVHNKPRKKQGGQAALH